MTDEHRERYLRLYGRMLAASSGWRKGIGQAVGVGWRKDNRQVYGMVKDIGQIWWEEWQDGRLEVGA